MAAKRRDWFARDRQRSPANWSEISPRVKGEAGWRRVARGAPPRGGWRTSHE